MYEVIRQRVFDILEVSTPTDRLSKALDLSLLILILLNIFSVILETVPSLASRHGRLFKQFDMASVAVFTVEYCLRLWVCTKDERYRQPVRGRLRFALTPLAVIDLLVIIPFFLPMFFNLDLRVIRALRFIRLTRILKMGRYSQSMRLFGSIIREKKEELLVAVSVVMLILLFASSAMYVIENPVQPDKFSSIPAAMWWGMATLTTVGYGDVYPITPLGKVLGSCIAFLGIGLFALPAGILASGFNEALARRNRPEGLSVCPHCGEVLDDPSTTVDT